jgi:hypothetical protein
MFCYSLPDLVLAVCPAGMGAASAAAACSQCPVNTYGDEDRAAGDLECDACPANPVSVFLFHIDESDHYVDVNLVSEPGAVSEQQCLLEFSSILAANW